MTTMPLAPDGDGSQATLRRGSAPLYRRIAEDVLLTIETLQMQPGSLLPTESELCTAYGVSRITVRKALEELVARQVIERRRGSGTYISSNDRITKAVVLTGCIDDVLMLNRMTVLEDAWHPLPDHIMAFANIDADREFKKIVGVNHITPGEPIVHITFWFPPGIGKRVSAADVAGPLPTIRHIERSYDVRLDHADQSLDAVSACAPVAAALGVKRGSPLLRALRAYYDTDDKLIEIFEAQYHPARYQFSAKLFPRQFQPRRPST
ncbi:MAG: GntR family transcriptional regulator [Lautropia sp.]